MATAYAIEGLGLSERRAWSANRGVTLGLSVQTRAG